MQPEPPFHDVRIDAFPQILFTASPAGAVVMLTARWTHATGRAIAEGLGDRWLAAVHPVDRIETEGAWRDSVARGVPFEARCRLCHEGDRAERWMLLRAQADRTGDGTIAAWYGSFTDIDDDKRASDTVLALAEASDAINSVHDLAPRLAAIARYAVPTLADWCGVYLLDERGRIDLVASAHHDPVLDERIAAMYREYRPRQDGPVAAAIRIGQPVLYPQADHASFFSRVAQDTRHAALLASFGFRAYYLEPLRGRSRLLGALVYGTALRDTFGPREIAIAHVFAERAATSVDDALQYEHEHRVAMRMQAVALPSSLPYVTGLTFDSVYEAGGTEALVGGDWYDAFVLPDGRVAITIGDVLGSGLDAAVLMGTLRKALRAGGVVGRGPAAMLRAADAAIVSDRPDAFATAFAGIIDPRTLEMTWANAGHPSPVLVQAGRLQPSLFVSGELPLGLRDLAKPQGERRFQLEPGAMLVLYTDGLVESTHDLAEGERRLSDALGRDDVRTAAHPASALRDAVLLEGARDDVAVLTVQLG